MQWKVTGAVKRRETQPNYNGCIIRPGLLLMPGHYLLSVMESHFVRSLICINLLETFGQYEYTISSFYTIISYREKCYCKLFVF